MEQIVCLEKEIEVKVPIDIEVSGMVEEENLVRPEETEHSVVVGIEGSQENIEDLRKVNEKNNGAVDIKIVKVTDDNVKDLVIY